MRKKIMQLFGGFLCVMLVFTMLSRAADGTSVAKVTTKKAMSGYVNHSVSGSGRVEALREQAVSTEDGQIVKTIYVEEGQSVEKGDLLFDLDMDELEEKLLNAKQELKKLKLQNQDAESQKAAQSQQEALSQTRAARDYQETAADNADAVADAWAAYETASKTLSDYIKNGAGSGGTNAGEDTVEAALLSDVAEKEAALAEAEEALERLNIQIELAVKEARNQAGGLGLQGRSVPAAENVIQRENTEKETEPEAVQVIGGCVPAAEEGTGIEVLVGSLAEAPEANTPAASQAAEAPETDKPLPETEIPETAATEPPETETPETDAPGTPPETEIPETDIPEVSRPDTDASLTLQNTAAWAGETSMPEASGTGTPKEEAAASESSTAGISATDFPAPELQTLGNTVPETSVSETSTSEALSAESQLPETPAPEAQAPETASPETSAPETTAPETTAPETSAPETPTSETSAPETAAPETTAPDTPPPILPDDPLGGGSSQATSSGETQEEAEERVRASYKKEKEKAEEAVNAASQALNDANAALNAYETSKIQDAETEGGAQKQQLLQAVQEKKEAYDAAVKAQRQGNKAAARQVEDSSLPKGSDSTAEINAITEEQQELSIKKLEALKKSGGKVTAPVSGVVTKIGIITGERTPDGTAVMLAEDAAGTKLSFLISKEQEKYVSKGDSVTIKPANTKEELTDYTVSSIEEDETEQDMIKVTVNLPKGALEIGTAAELEVTRQSENYTQTLPIQAVYEETGRSYVLAVRETKGILGTEYQASRIDVTVLDKNDTTAAVQEGTLTSDQKIIVSADRTVQDGSKVRLKEDGGEE